MEFNHNNGQLLINLGQDHLLSTNLYSIVHKVLWLIISLKWVELLSYKNQLKFINITINNLIIPMLIRRKFNSWKQNLKSYMKWLNPDFPMMEGMMKEKIKTKVNLVKKKVEVVVLLILKILLKLILKKNPEKKIRNKPQLLQLKKSPQFSKMITLNLKNIYNYPMMLKILLNLVNNNIKCY